MRRRRFASMCVAAALALPALGAAPERESPGERLGHSLVFDATLGRVVLFDGYWPDSDRRADLWSWSGARWEPQLDSGPPSASMGSAAFDARRREVVVHGGTNAGGAKRQTWTWSRRTSLQSADTAPGARFHHAMAYDGARDRVVMYGGMARGVWDTTTWEWNGTRWMGRALPSPGPRAAFRVAYDAKRKQIVLFGGVSGADQRFLNDTWVFDGTTWRKVADTGPAPRRDYSMSYDDDAGVVLLYGGASQTRYADMWQWDGARWSEIRLASPNPGHRYIAAMAYDPARRRTVLYGGYACGADGKTCGVGGDTWEWDWGGWRKVQ